jgi:CubicO group peptidase (beta-lactamase class C family)
MAHMDGSLTYDLRRVHRKRRAVASRFAVLASIAVAGTGTGGQTSAPGSSPTLDLPRLEARLESLRDKWNVPGMVAGISSGNQIVWTNAFGYADLTTRAPATPDTVFHLASLTKPFAAVVLLQLVERRQLDLDAPVDQFGITLKADGVIRVRHLLTHTSEGTPGEEFRYSGNRFAQLDKVLSGVTGMTFAELVGERVLTPLALANTSPNPFNPAACAAADRDPEVFLRRSARGYAGDGKTPVEYPAHFVTAAGLVSTVGDVLRFSIGLDRGQLLQSATKELAFSPARSSRGRVLPYGFGWFVQNRRGVKIVWHYGWDRANSSLIIKVPEREVAFVLLGNSEGLSRKFDLGRDEDVTRSPFAREFLRTIGL